MKKAHRKTRQTPCLTYGIFLNFIKKQIKFIFDTITFNQSVQYIYVCPIFTTSKRTYLVESLPQKLTESELLLIKNCSN